MDDNAPRQPRPPAPAPAPEPPVFGPSLALLAVALGAVLGALAWWWTAAPPQSPASPEPPAAVAAASAAQPAAPLPPPPPAAAAASAPAVAVAQVPPRPVQPPTVSRNRDPDGDQTPDLSDYVNAGEQPTMTEVITRLQQAGVRTGLAAFNPPGTRPPLQGLAVPEDFPLPPGYVRHHQATDDGQRIEAILMFAPGFQPLDAVGRPVAVPADRVVPPHLAPPGLPLRRITIPPPAPEPPRTGR